MPISPFLLGPFAGMLRPVRSWVERERRLLGFQGHQYIGVKMHRPIVLHYPDAFCLRIGGSHLLIERNQFIDPNFAGLPKENAPKASIERPNQPGLGVAAIGLVSMGTICPCQFILVADARLAIIGHLVQVEKHLLAC